MRTAVRGKRGQKKKTDVEAHPSSHCLATNPKPAQEKAAANSDDELHQLVVQASQLAHERNRVLRELLEARRKLLLDLFDSPMLIGQSLLQSKPMKREKVKISKKKPAKLIPPANQ